MIDLEKLWQEQPTEPFRMRIEEMEKKRRRAIFDGYLVFVTISAFVIWMAVISPNVLMRIGATLTVAGFAFLTWQKRGHLLAPAPVTSSSVEACRAELERQLTFFRKGLRTRIAAISPGPLLFSFGFAAAYPQAAPIIYFQIATFVLIVAIIPSLYRRKIQQLEREIAELHQLAD